MTGFIPELDPCLRHRGEGDHPPEGRRVRRDRAAIMGTPPDGGPKGQAWVDPADGGGSN